MTLRYVINYNACLCRNYTTNQHGYYYYFHMFISPIAKIGLLLGLYKVMNPVKFIDNISSMKTE